MLKTLIFEAWQNTLLPIRVMSSLTDRKPYTGKVLTQQVNIIFGTLADNAEPLCLMSLKQFFYFKNSLMACYLLHPLKTFSFLPDTEMTYSIQKRKKKTLRKNLTVFPDLGSCFGHWNSALSSQMKSKVRYRRIPLGELNCWPRAFSFDKWEKAAMALYVGHKQLSHSCLRQTPQLSQFRILLLLTTRTFLSVPWRVKKIEH